jgi:hypothetical protein
VNKLRTHYDNLKVSRDAPPEVIRMAYKALVTKYHPDRNGNSAQSVQIMQAINDSYEILMNEESRQRHDRWIASQERPMLEGPRTVANWESAEELAPRRKSGGLVKSGCLAMASSLCAMLFIVFAIAATLTAPVASSSNRAATKAAAPKSDGRQPNATPFSWPEADRPPVADVGIVNVYWDGKHHPVLAERAAAIRKKVDVASGYVNEYLKLREEKSALEKQLKNSVFGKKPIQDKIADVDARMNELNASGMKVIREVEAEIKAAAP